MLNMLILTLYHRRTVRGGEIKACTHTPTSGGSALESALESADYNAESANSIIDFVRVG